jgi:hypothetical protein
MQDLFEGAEIISAYTRKQAISDGVLVDMGVEPFGKLAKEAGLKWPIAMTATAFGEFVAVTDAPGRRGQDLSGRWKCVSGPDDEGEPCLTFMLPGED